jgi:hypothetical protein
LCMAWPLANAQTADTSPARTSKARKSQTPKPPADKGPAETRTERDKRLLRECRGRPNAGACEGYAT